MDPSQHRRPISAVVLAAGEGTRMRSRTPKPLHRLCGRPMILHVLDTLAEVAVTRVVVVVGHGANEVTKVVQAEAPRGLELEFVEQPEACGTGDAVAVGLTGFPDTYLDLEEADLLVVPGDAPLVRPPTLALLVRRHREQGAAATLLTTRTDGSLGYPRVVRDKDGRVARVARDDLDELRIGESYSLSGSADGPRSRTAAGAGMSVRSGGDEDVESQDLAPGSPEGREAGVGVEAATNFYCFRHGVLAPALRRIPPDPMTGEYPLVAAIEVLHDAGYDVTSVPVGDPVEAAGINDRAQLAAATSELRARLNESWMRRGVTMVDPEATYVEVSVSLAPDVVLLPGVVLEGSTTIGEGAVIGPNARLVDCQVGAGARLEECVAEHAAVGAGAAVGAFSVLEPGARLAPGERVGPFFGRG